MVESLKPYSVALYDLAKEMDKVDFYLDQLKVLKGIWEENVDFVSALGHPKITRVQKKEWISNLFEKDLDSMLYRYLLVLNEHNVVSNIPGIYDAYVECYREDHNIEIVQVETASELDDNQIQSIKNLLEQKLNKNIELVIKINPELMAGIRVRTNDLVLDNSLLSRFNALKEKLNTID